MNFNINHELARDPSALEVFCDYLEENAVTVRDQNHYLFLRTRQHEERGFCDSRDGLPMIGSFVWGNGYGNGSGGGYGNGNGSGGGYGNSGNGYGYGYGYSYDNGDGYGFGDGEDRPL
jgi:hypothetical protein